jgi:hypothetical protein
MFQFKGGLPVKSELVKQEQGNALIEVVAFAAIGFGLVLTLGFQMLEQERKVLELKSLSRNAMRSFLLSPSTDIFDEVFRLQSDSQLLAQESLSVSTSCLQAECSKPNTLIWLELQAGDLSAKAFGFTGG